MESDITWTNASAELPAPGEWVAVVNAKHAEDYPAPFPAKLVETPHGNLWQVLTADPEKDIPYAPIHARCLWAKVEFR